jgi:hypothetical protein
MKRFLSNVLTFSFTVLGAGTFASAQEFNLDVGGAGNIVPAPAFAAAGQPGLWDTIGLTGGVAETLVDVNGVVTSVTLTLSVTSTLITSTTNLAGATADDIALMTDILDPGQAGASWTLAGLAPGEYDLYTYAMAPDSGLYLTDVTVVGSVDPTQSVGGTWPNAYVQGVTHARHRITATGAPITIQFVETVTPPGSFTSIGGLQIVRVDSSGAAYCTGDGLDPNVTTPCPCANVGTAGNGCANSTNPAGANLTATGSTNPDTIVLAGSGMPATVACIYLQGDADNVTGVTFGDGVRCVDGTLIRLRTKVNVGGASTFPEAGVDTITLSVRGGVVPGSGATRFYQTYYRNAAALFCPPETFNVTNGWRITW